MASERIEYIHTKQEQYCVINIFQKPYSHEMQGNGYMRDRSSSERGATDKLSDKTKLMVDLHFPPKNFHYC